MDYGGIAGPIGKKQKPRDYIQGEIEISRVPQ
jgi:hypothetical protein